MDWYWWIVIILIILIGIWFIRRINGGDSHEESFLSRAVGNVDNGCKKLIERIRGC